MIAFLLASSQPYYLRWLKQKEPLCGLCTVSETSLNFCPCRFVYQDTRVFWAFFWARVIAVCKSWRCKIYKLLSMCMSSQLTQRSRRCLNFGQANPNVLFLRDAPSSELIPRSSCWVVPAVRDINCFQPLVHQNSSDKICKTDLWNKSRKHEKTEKQHWNICILNISQHWKPCLQKRPRWSLWWTCRLALRLLVSTPASLFWGHWATCSRLRQSCGPAHRLRETWRLGAAGGVGRGWHGNRRMLLLYHYLSLIRRVLSGNLKIYGHFN